VTDQTAAHDAVKGYLPAGWSLEEWAQRREIDPEGVARAAKASMAQQARCWNG
jgi:urocanate hydratase